jgi:predicted metalloenzyme YecM
MAEAKVGNADYIPFIKADKFEIQVRDLAQRCTHRIQNFEINRLAILCSESSQEDALRGAFRDASDIMGNLLGYELLELGIWVKKESPNFSYGRNF